MPIAFGRKQYNLISVVVVDEVTFWIKIMVGLILKISGLVSHDPISEAYKYLNNINNNLKSDFKEAFVNAIFEDICFYI